MTKVNFYTKVSDQTAFCSRLIAQAYHQQQTLWVVLSSLEELERLSKQLWSFSDESFVAHSIVHQANFEEARIVLGLDLNENLAHAPKWLLNLTQDFPDNIDRFEKIFEVVGEDVEDLSAARLRFAHYRDLGAEIEHFDRSGK